MPTVGPATAVAAGWEHTCALTRAGTVFCWGANGHGQLGTGSTTPSLVPVAVPQLTGVTAIQAGAEHTCAITGTGAGAVAVCWGRNDHGQLGDGTTVDRPSPVNVGGLAQPTAIAAGGLHTCALAGGEVWCWGANADGQLGNGLAADRSTPVSVAAASGVTFIAAGGAHTCVVGSGGAMQCWGLGTSGQLGNGATSTSAVPTAVSALGSPATAVCAGNAHTCAVTAAGTRCWGYGQYGQLGNGGTADSAVPVAVGSLATTAAPVASGGQHACAIDTAGAVWCWGEDATGQLGDDGSDDSTAPVAVKGLASGAVALSGGTAHTCVVLGTGAVECWGWNVSGQLGDGTQVDRGTPGEVLGF